LTPDPENGGYTDDPGSLNAYIYANGDPANANDPTGLDVDIPITSGGDPNSCLNKTVLPWMQSHGFNISTNFGGFGNTATGVMALTLFFEQTTGSATLYGDIAQVMVNRYNLAQVNPALAANLFGISNIGSMNLQQIAEVSSNVWSNGNLLTNFENQLITMMNTSVVGPSNSTNAGACNQFISAANTAVDAVDEAYDKINPFPWHGDVSFQTYWFYVKGYPNPVNSRFWDVTSEPVTSGNTTWIFETFVAPKKPPRRHR
jgi:hypothetical protein